MLCFLEWRLGGDVVTATAGLWIHPLRVFDVLLMIVRLCGR